MASDGLSFQDPKKKKKVSRKGKDEDPNDPDVQVVIEKLTVCGYSALQQGDCSEALKYFKKAFKTAVKLKETKVQCACAFNLGAAYVEAGKPQKALDFLSQAEPAEKGERVADLQFNMAAAYEALKDHKQAVRHYQEAAQIYRSQGDGSSEGDTCVKLAHCHLRKKEWIEAAQNYLRAADSYKVAGKPASAAVALKDAGNHMIQCSCFSADDVIGVLTECLELSAKIMEKETLGKLFNSVGLSFSQLKLFTEAAECFELALPLVRSSPHRLAVVMQNLGAVHNSLGQYQKAVFYHKEAAALHGLLGSRQSQGRCFCNLGYALNEQGELEEAGESYLHAQQAFKDSDDCLGHWKACENLGGLRMRMRDPDKAILYYKQALTMLSNCKDISNCTQEQLVSKLSEALQLKLAMQQHGSPVRRTIQKRNFTRQHLCMAQTKHAEEMLDEQGKREPKIIHKWRAEETYGQQKPYGDTVISSEAAHIVEPDHTNILSVANRNLNNTYKKLDLHYPNPNLSNSHVLPQQDEPRSENPKQKPELTSEVPLVGNSATLPPAHLNSEAATFIHKSRFCTVM